MRRYDLFNVRVRAAVFAENGVTYRRRELWDAPGPASSEATFTYRGPNLTLLARPDDNTWPELLVLTAPGILEVGPAGSNSFMTGAGQTAVSPMAAEFTAQYARLTAAHESRLEVLPPCASRSMPSAGPTSLAARRHALHPQQRMPGHRVWHPAAGGGWHDLPAGAAAHFLAARRPWQAGVRELVTRALRWCRMTKATVIKVEQSCTALPAVPYLVTAFATVAGLDLGPRACYFTFVSASTATPSGACMQHCAPRNRIPSCKCCLYQVNIQLARPAAWCAVIQAMQSCKQSMQNARPSRCICAAVLVDNLCPVVPHHSAVLLMEHACLHAGVDAHSNNCHKGGRCTQRAWLQAVE
jgi:hypothetical protein